MIFDINRNIKVQWKLARHLALQVTSLAEAKQVFGIKTNCLAGLACLAGLVNPHTSAFEMTALAHELRN